MISSSVLRTLCLLGSLVFVGNVVAESNPPAAEPPIDFEALLDRRVEGSLVDVPLREVLNYLGDVTGQPINIDQSRIKYAVGSLDDRVTFRWAGTTSVRAIAAYCLGSRDLVLVPSQEYEAFVVMDRESEPQIVRMYDLTDLVDAGLWQDGTEFSATYGFEEEYGEEYGREYEEDYEDNDDEATAEDADDESRDEEQSERKFIDAGRFISLIENQSGCRWEAVDGEGGAIHAATSPDRLIIVVRTGYHDQKKVESLLNELRRQFDLPPQTTSRATDAEAKAEAKVDVEANEEVDEDVE